MKEFFALIPVLFVGVAAFALQSGGPLQADTMNQLGAYLSAECTACHQLNGVTPGIPSIVGLP